MSTVCGNCGWATGPFARIWIGTRKNGRWIITCPDDQTRACIARRVRQDIERWGDGLNVHLVTGG